MTDAKTPAQAHADLLWAQIDAAGKRDQVAPQLVEMAAETWARWQEAAELVRQQGLTLTNSHGVVANPAATVEARSCVLYQQLLGRMGISATPSQARYTANRPVRLAPVGSITELVNRAPVRVPKVS